MSAPITSQLSVDQADELFSIYCDYIQADDSTKTYGKIFADDFPSVQKCEFAWQKLEIGMPLEQIKGILQKDNVLQLRSIDAESRTLIIGCGNKPIVNAAGFPIGKHEGDGNYENKHAHEGAITINPHLASNPTLVGFFGSQAFPMIADGQFDLIVIEGTYVGDTPIGRSELSRIASKTAQIVIAGVDDPEAIAFSWEENSKSVWAEGYVSPPSVMDLTNHPCFACKK